VTTDEKDSQRLDKWLWHARFFKSRTLASQFCESAGVRIGGQPVRKAHYQIKPGDVLTFSQGSQVRVVRVLALSPRRLSPPLARALYEDLDPPPPRGTTSGDPPGGGAGERERGSGRPTKAERRALQRLKAID
jgi:ribosome-associated heat shock protein Hsp15